MLEIHQVDAMRQDFGYAGIIGDSVADVARRNAQKIEVARLEQERDAINKNLKAQHRIMIATLILAFVAVISTIVAVIIALTANPPTVMVRLEQPNKQKTIQTSN